MKGIFRVKEDGTLSNTPVVSASTSDQCWVKFNGSKGSLNSLSTSQFKCTDLNFED